MVSCGLRPQFLASWHLAILPFVRGQPGHLLAPRREELSSSLRTGSEANPELGEGKGGPCYYFACTDRSCLGVSHRQPHLPHMHRCRNQFLGLFPW